MKNNSSDNLQYGINEAAIYFYKMVLHKDEKGVYEEKKVSTKQMTPTLMMGVGYFIAKGFLFYRGDMHFRPTDQGLAYFHSLIENGDIE